MEGKGGRDVGLCERPALSLNFCMEGWGFEVWEDKSPKGQLCSHCLFCYLLAYTSLLWLTYTILLFSTGEANGPNRGGTGCLPLTTSQTVCKELAATRQAIRCQSMSTYWCYVSSVVPEKQVAAGDTEGGSFLFCFFLLHPQHMGMRGEPSRRGVSSCI